MSKLAPALALVGFLLLTAVVGSAVRGGSPPERADENEFRPVAVEVEPSPHLTPAIALNTVVVTAD